MTDRKIIRCLLAGIGAVLAAIIIGGVSDQWIIRLPLIVAFAAIQGALIGHFLPDEDCQS